MLNTQNLTLGTAQKEYSSDSIKCFLENQLKQLFLLIPTSFSVFIYRKKCTLIIQKACFLEKVEKSNLPTKIDHRWNLDFGKQVLPLLKLRKIALERNSISYICPLTTNNLADREYLLFFCLRELSDLEQESVELQAKLIGQYLELEQAYTQQSNKIEMLEYSLHSIGHELRSPLGYISILIENIRLSLSQNSSLQQLGLIQETIKELNDYLTHLLQWSKKSQLNFEEQDIKQIFHESLENLQYLAVAKKIKVKYPEETAFINIDRFQIKQIFDNLLSNSIHFSPEVGTIICDWQLFQEEILITICDQGRGLSPEDIRHIFSPFYSRRNGGTGLGLTLVKKIIGDCRGNIWAENLPEGGTKIAFTLPRY